MRLDGWFPDRDDSECNGDSDITPTKLIGEHENTIEEFHDHCTKDGGTSMCDLWSHEIV